MRERDGMVPELRVRPVNDRPERPDRKHVVYWMVATRRVRDNFGLQRAAERARDLGKPLVVFEALRDDYPWRSERFDRFVVDGMRENAARCARAGVTYLPYVGGDDSLLARLAGDAALVVTDDYPCFFLPRMVAAAGKRLDVRLEAVDSNGLLPMRAADRAFKTAHAFRRFLHREIKPHLEQMPEEDPLHGLARAEVDWPHALPAGESHGGSAHAERRWRAFLDDGIDGYGRQATSHLSPYLHFGHIGAHTLFRAIAERDGWTPDATTPPDDGRRSGWWGLGEATEAFLDQLVTWRELGFNACSFLPDYDRYESLPDWAQATLADHAGDERDHLYTFDEFDAAETHDELWNAAQRQLVRDGVIDNYLRMLWGKMILAWSGSPREALETMIELNNRHALDGRDPNSYSGIFWVLGRYDRAWGPERPVFGKIRYMTSQNTRRKLDLRAYLERYGRA